MIKILILTFTFLFIPIGNNAKTLYDSERCDLKSLFGVKNVKYIIRYPHQFRDTLYVPKNCDIFFEGGLLSGPIVFDKTKLSGNVNLKGSSVRGTLRNKTFDASWLCAMDGVTDDAPSINKMIEICGNIYFPKGIYRLVSEYNPLGRIPEENFDAIKCHIGINKSNVSLRGEEGAVFLTDKLLGTMCIYTTPNQIENSIKNIKIEKITFSVRNDAQRFNQFMHTIKTMGVKGLIIKDCVFDDFWGDAICLSHYGDNPSTGERSRNQDIKILNNRIVGGEHHNNRNGISVINGKNVLIKGNTIKNTSRNDMPGAIDVEPNNETYTIDNISIIDNIIEGCWGTAGGICINANEFKGPAHKIRIINNHINKCTSGLAFVVKSDGTTCDYIIKNNIVKDNTLPYQFVGEGSSRNWHFSDNTFERACRQDIPGKIKVENLVVKNNKKKD